MSTNDYTSSNPFPDGPRNTQQPGTNRHSLNEPNPLTEPQTDLFPTETVEPIPAHAQGFGDGDLPGGGQPSGKSQAAQDLAQEGRESATHVVDSAKQEAAMLAEQAKDQSAHLLDELGSDLKDQAAAQQRKVAANLRDISEEFRSMLDQSSASGTASTLVDQASHHSGRAADWLEQREPSDLLNEVKSFARKRPGAFLGLALGAGLLAGRMTRNASEPKDSTGHQDQAHHTDPAAKPVAAYEDAPAPPPRVDPSFEGTSRVDSAGIRPAVDSVDVDPLRSYPPEDPRSTNYR
jgi:chemotaxis protein histidine kinase CheA